MNYQNSFPGYPNSNANYGPGGAHFNTFTNNISPSWGPYSGYGGQYISAGGYNWPHSVLGYGQQFGATNQNPYFQTYQNNAFPQVQPGTPFQPPLPPPKPKSPPPPPPPREPNPTDIRPPLSPISQICFPFQTLKFCIQDLEVSSASDSNDSGFKDLMNRKITAVATCFQNIFGDDHRTLFMSQILEKCKSDNPQQSLAFLWVIVVALQLSHHKNPTRLIANSFLFAEFQRTFVNLVTHNWCSLQRQHRLEELVVLRNMLGQNFKNFDKVDLILKNMHSGAHWDQQMSQPNDFNKIEDFYPLNLKVYESNNHANVGTGNEKKCSKPAAKSNLDKFRSYEAKKPRWKSQRGISLARAHLNSLSLSFESQPEPTTPQLLKDVMQSDGTTEYNKHKPVSNSVDKPAASITKENSVTFKYKGLKGQKSAIINHNVFYPEYHITEPDDWWPFHNKPDRLHKTTKSDNTAKLKQRKDQDVEVIDLCEKPVSSTIKTKKRKTNNEVPKPDGWPFFNERDQLSKTTKSDKTAKLKLKELRYEIIDLCEKPVKAIETKKHKKNNKIPVPEKQKDEAIIDSEYDNEYISFTTSTTFSTKSNTEDDNSENILNPAITLGSTSASSNKSEPNSSPNSVPRSSTLSFHGLPVLGNFSSGSGEDICNAPSSFSSSSGEMYNLIDEILNAATPFSSDSSHKILNARTFSSRTSDKRCSSCNKVLTAVMKYQTGSTSFDILSDATTFSSTSNKKCSTCSELITTAKRSKTDVTSLSNGSSNEILDATTTISSGTTKDTYCKTCREIFKISKTPTKATISFASGYSEEILNAVPTFSSTTSDQHCTSCKQIFKTAKISRDVTTPYCSASGKIYSSMDEILNTASLSSCTSGEVYNTIDEILNAANHFSSMNSEEYNGSSIEILAERSKNTGASPSDKSEPNSPSKVSHSSCTLSFHGLPILCESNPDEAERESKDPEENRVIVVHDKMSLEKFVDNILAKTVKYWGIVKQSDGQFAMQFVHSKKVIVFKTEN